MSINQQSKNICEKLPLFDYMRGCYVCKGCIAMMVLLPDKEVVCSICHDDLAERHDTIKTHLPDVLVDIAFEFM